MARVLITGMSGVGKTRLLDLLQARGHQTVDTDYDGWVLSDGRWDEARMRSLLDDHRDIVDACEAHHVEALMTRADHATGSDRLAEACVLLGLDGTEVFDFTGIEALNDGKTPKTVHVKATKDGARPSAYESMG